MQQQQTALAARVKTSVHTHDSAPLYRPLHPFRARAGRNLVLPSERPRGQKVGQVVASSVAGAST